MHPRAIRAICGAVVLGAIVAPNATAQNPGFGNAQPFHAIALTAGAAALSVDPVNAVLTNSGFSSLPSRAMVGGAAAYFAFGRALLGANVQRARVGERGSGNGRTDDLTANAVAITGGYAVVSTNRLSVYPMVGVGLGRFAVTLHDNSGAPAATATQPTFAELAQSPGAASTLAGTHLVFDVGMGQDYLLKAPAQEGASVTIGVRAGIVAAPNRTTWRSGARTVVAGPDASVGGPYLRVAVGVARR